MSLTLNVGDVTYHEKAPSALEMHMGADRVFEWSSPDGKGYVATRRNAPPLCSCALSICRHIGDIKGFENDGTWDEHPRPAA